MVRTKPTFNVLTKCNGAKIENQANSQKSHNNGLISAAPPKPGSVIKNTLRA
jgi:hypothetical protein